MMHHAVLSAVAELGPVSQAELGRSLSIDPKDMVAIVNELQSRGLVTRTPDPKDRRKNAIAISVSGRRRLRRTEELGDEANAELTAALSPRNASSSSPCSPASSSRRSSPATPRRAANSAPGPCQDRAGTVLRSHRRGFAGH